MPCSGAESRADHGAGKSTRMQIEEVADECAALAKNLDMGDLRPPSSWSLFW